MALYRKKPVVVEATQWFKNGDHPEDQCMAVENDGGAFVTEGKVVRFFRHPEVPGNSVCPRCGEISHHHGWIDTDEDGQIVCPGDWIITEIWIVNDQQEDTPAQKHYYSCKPNVFEAAYDKVDVQ